jgi:2-(1,2-epoxy-1,2-dihydrophenyl)acetyl-CoA isomerase
MCCEKKAYGSLLYEVENRIATITMNEPKKLNALDARLASEITAALGEAKDDESVKVVVLTGAGKAFCAGGDISVFTKLDLEGSIKFVKDAHSLVGAFTKMPKPVIAAVNGFAVGAGLSLTLLSDIVISSDKAMYGAAFVNVGLVPDIGSLYFLPRLVGLQKAKELAFTGKNIDANEAYRLGIVNTVVGHETFGQAVQDFSKLLAGQSGSAMGYAKQLLNSSFDLGIDELLEIEAITQGVCMQSADSKEGVDAFINKRKAVFK